MDKVLVVDDDVAILRVIAMTLQVEGFEVDPFSSPIEALAAISDGHHPDALVLDLNMPQMNGRELYAEARRCGFDKPVLILSAYGADKAASELGAQAWLAKPFEPWELASKLRQITH